MWVAKLSMKHENDIFTERAFKYQINFYAYPLTNYKKAGKHLFSVAGLLDGEPKAMALFLKDLKKDKRVKILESKNNFINILIIYSPSEINKSDMEIYYDKSIIHIEPVLNSKEGLEYWTIGSFERENLTRLIDSAIKSHNGKLISLTNSKLDNLSLINLTPKITEKQKKVIIEAFRQGYYNYPRKIEIKKLAAILGLSYSTCQEHLRRAEISLIPGLIKKL